MKKVRVLREMPFAKKGIVFIFKKDSLLINLNGGSYQSSDIELLVQNGWLEWVEEERPLEAKLQVAGVYGNYNDLAQIAKDHTLEVFDKARTEAASDLSMTLNSQNINYIRKALEDSYVKSNTK